MEFYSKRKIKTSEKNTLRQMAGDKNYDQFNEPKCKQAQRNHWDSCDRDDKTGESITCNNRFADRQIKRSIRHSLFYKPVNCQSKDHDAKPKGSSEIQVLRCAIMRQFELIGMQARKSYQQDDE